MNAEERKRVRLRLKRDGFDLTTSHRDGYVRVRCSQCNAVFINGVACHEIGCPNQRRKRR